MSENRIDFVKWFRALIYITIARFVNTLVGIPALIPTAVTVWIGRMLMAGMVFTMFKLAPANDRYKKTGILLTIVLVLTIATDLLRTGAVLALIAGILSIIAEYQEYHGHSELIEEKDHQLSGKWTSLFMWSILVGVILGFASTAAGFLTSLAGVDTEKAAVMIAAALTIPEYIIAIFYILYLKKMVAIASDGFESRKLDNKKNGKSKKRIAFTGMGLIAVIILLFMFSQIMINPSGSGKYDRYHGPVLPLTSLNGAEGVEVRRNVNFDFSPYQNSTQYAKIGMGAINITDTYVLTNTTGEKQTTELVYGFLGQFIDYREEFPTITINGAEIQPKLYPSVDTDALVWNAMDFEQYSRILTENDFLAVALQQADPLDIPVTAYHFSELAYSGTEVAGCPMLTLRCGLDENTTVWASVAHESGTEDDGRTRMMFRVDHGDAWVFTFGGKLIDPEYGGNRDYNISQTSGIDGVTFKLETFETTLGKAIRELSQSYDFWSIEGYTYPNPGYMTPDLLVDGAVKRIQALRYLEPSERIRMIEDLFYNVVTEARMIYMVFPVELDAGQAITVEAAYVQEASFDIPYGTKSHREGYELATKLGSNLNFTAQTAAIVNTSFIDQVEQNFGFDLKNGITNVNLDLQMDRYYIELKIK